MTNEEMLTDLKQFITVTISQEMANVATKDDINRLDAKIDTKVDGLREEMNDRFDEVINVMGEAIDETNKDFNKKYHNHEVRLQKLEAKNA